MFQQGLTYCREGAGRVRVRISRKYCPICKRKIRGRNHKNGTHHQKALRETEAK